MGAALLLLVVGVALLLLTNVQCNRCTNNLLDVAQEQGKGEVLNEVRHLVSSGLSNIPRHWNQHPIRKFSRIRSQLCVVDSVLCRKYTPGPLEKEKIVPVVPLSLQPTPIKANHDIISSGHQGVEKTLQRLNCTAFWIGMAKDTELYTGVVWCAKGPSCQCRYRSNDEYSNWTPLANVGC